MFHTFEYTDIWGLSNHILAFLPADGPPLTLVLLVVTDVELPPLHPYDPHARPKGNKHVLAAVHLWCLKCAVCLVNTTAPCSWSVFACHLPN